MKKLFNRLFGRPIVRAVKHEPESNTFVMHQIGPYVAQHVQYCNSIGLKYPVWDFRVVSVKPVNKDEPVLYLATWCVSMPLQDAQRYGLI